MPLWDLSPRQVRDLEQLMNRGFHPLNGFMTRVDYPAAVETMRMSDSNLRPMPITLNIGEKFAETIEPGQVIALHAQGVILATMTSTDKGLPVKTYEAKQVFAADDLAHPAVNFLQPVSGSAHPGGR